MVMTLVETIYYTPELSRLVLGKIHDNISKSSASRISHKSAVPVSNRKFLIQLKTRELNFPFAGH